MLNLILSPIFYPPADELVSRQIRETIAHNDREKA